MSEKYNPPFAMTEEITNLTIEIGELVGAISTYESLNPSPVLRRESRIKTIYSVSYTHLDVYKRQSIHLEILKESEVLYGK